MSNFKNEEFGISTIRRNYQKSKEDLPVLDLLELQTSGFQKFINSGITRVFNDIFPINSQNKKITISFKGSRIEFTKTPLKDIKESKRMGKNYDASIKASLEMVNNATGEVVKENDVFISNLPIMTPGGSFIINGSERVIISQIVRAPGVYYEDMKAAKSQASVGATILKQGAIIPSRGSWIEYEYKDFKLLNSKPSDVKIKLNKSKKGLTAQVFYSLGMTPEEFLNIFGADEIIVQTTAEKVTKEQSEPEEARKSIFKLVSPSERMTPKSIMDTFPNFFMNKRRYDLMPIGRYKLNKKLSIMYRLFGQTIAEDILDKKDKVIVAKNKVVKQAEYDLIKKAYDENNLKLTQVSTDQYFAEKMNEEGATNGADLTQVVVAKIYLEDPHTGEKRIANVVGNVKTDVEFLTVSDLIASFGHLVNNEQGISHYDDIDSLENRKIKSVSELLENQFRIGLTRLEKNLRDRASTKDVSSLTLKSIVNHKLVEAAFKEFFNSSSLSQFMDQINPLAEIENKRRLTSLGPGGISRDTASMAIRAINDSHYGRIDPIETPEGPNIGLILNLAVYSRMNKYGLLETPYFSIKNGTINYKDVVYMTTDRERLYNIIDATVKVSDKNEIANSNLARTKDGFKVVSKSEANFIDVSSKEFVSVATAHIPFLENDDANRALMGSNMQRQAVPLITPSAPIVATGMESAAAKYSPQLIKALEDGVVEETSSSRIVIAGKTKMVYDLMKFEKSNQGTSMTQWSKVKKGQKIKAGEIIADGPSIDNGEIALGKNVLVAFTTWRGYNYEDAAIISSRLVKDDVYTSIHIEQLTVEQRETKISKEEITSDIPNASKEATRNLGPDGIIVVGSKIKNGDVLVGKLTPKGEDDSTPEERLLDAILGKKSKNMKDTSLHATYSSEGIVTRVDVLSRENGDKLDDGVEQIIHVYVAQKRKIKAGDKLAGRHGNKAVISVCLPEEDMPFLEDGTPIDIMLNPLGVPSRMNIGQVLEMHLGLAAKNLGIQVATPVFSGVDVDDLKDIMKEAKMPDSGKYTLTDGISGEQYDQKVTVGVMYVLKLAHMIDDKLHARSVGPYSLITQQPLRGKSNNGGQRFGEMETWALEAYGASNLLQEMMTIKSDDIKGRNELYSAIVKGKKFPESNIPEGFWVLFYEMRGLGLSLTFLDDNNEEILVDNKI